MAWDIYAHSETARSAALSTTTFSMISFVHIASTTLPLMTEQTLLAGEHFCTRSTLRGHIGVFHCKTNLVVVKTSVYFACACELTVHSVVVKAQPMSRREVHLVAATHTPHGWTDFK